MRRFVLAMLLSCFCFTSFSAGDILSELQSTKPLPKKHYLGPVYDQQLIEPTSELKEVFRICGSIPIGDNKVEAIASAAKLSKELGVDLSIIISPWPVSRCPESKATPGSLTQWAEVLYWARWMKEVKDVLGDVRVSAIFIDDERWVDQAAIMLPYRQALQNIAKELFSEVSIVWYAYGSVTPNASSTGWSKGTDIFGGLYLADIHSVSLYCISQEYRSQESYKRTVLLAGGNSVIPWIALNAGYEPKSDVFHVWNYDWDYGLVWACRFGAQVNQKWYVENEDRQNRYAPWNKAPFVVLYPGCSSGGPIKNRTTKWLNYFCAYARGAHGNNSLKGLE